MPDRSSAATRAPLTLVERKQRAARTRIIEAADALFADRGFANVSVTDIAEQAEVGRTTFFRHFADKTEVVFAKEQALFDTLTQATEDTSIPAHSLGTLAGAVSALEPLVLHLCRQATADPIAYQRHTMLVDAHEELRGREALKHQDVAATLAQVLTAHGAAHDIATLAAHLALACYTSGRTLATASGDLTARTRDAFRDTLAIDSARRSDPTPA